MNDKKYVNIRVEGVTANKLKEIGKKSETYDDLINRLIGGLEIDKDGVMCAYTAAIHTNQSLHAEQPWYISIHPVTLDDDVEYAKGLMRKGLDNITQEDLRGNMSIAGYDAERKQTLEILRSSHLEIVWQAWAGAIKRKEEKE